MADVRSGLDPRDYRYINQYPDPDFSPERNKAVVNETIKEAEQYFDIFHKAKDKDLENRVDVLSSYGRYRFNRGVKTIEGYLGRKLYESLIGEELLSKLRVADSVNRLNGNTKFKKGVLL